MSLAKAEPRNKRIELAEAILIHCDPQAWASNDEEAWRRAYTAADLILRKEATPNEYYDLFDSNGAIH